jgi:histone acetyltransferase (RNA polymerase elongator complex component)
LKHVTIPIFIPGAACPFQCIFCDQKKISGAQGFPSHDSVNRTIQRNLKTIHADNVHVEVGFFGGTFTGLSLSMQEQYLRIVRSYIESGRIRQIRISTRPDFITAEILNLLKTNFVKTIELGAQSMDDAVLQASNRGHSVADTKKASGQILDAGFVLGLQMMIGLPGDSEEKSVRTAMEIVELKASETRIYPALVIKGTEFERLYSSGKYKPLSLEEAIRQSMKVVQIFTPAGVRILRIGLHPSEALTHNESLVAGPFHPSFKELVMTEIWNERFRSDTFLPSKRGIRLHINPAEYNNAVGYHGKNREFFSSLYQEVRFISDPDIQLNRYHVDYC